MPVESARTIGKKKFKTPAGDIWVPVVLQISFTDDADRGQEYRITVDNSADADRDVIVSWVGSKGSGSAKEDVARSADVPGDCVAVERIIIWRHIDAVDRGQETNVTFDNQTFDKNGPPFFTTHLKTHIVTYHADQNDKTSPGIKSELIDEFSIIGERGQEEHYFLANPIDDDEANLQITPDTPDVTAAPGDGVDPAYRVDPFQNIVEIPGYYVMFAWFWFDYYYDGIQDYQTGNADGSFNAYPGIDGWGIRNNLTADMIGDTGDPLSTEDLLNGFTDTAGGDGSAVQTLDAPMNIGHVIDACGFSYVPGINIGQVNACPVGAPDATFVSNGTLYDGHEYHQTWLFTAGASTPPSADDDNPTTYVPTKFKIKFDKIYTAGVPIFEFEAPIIAPGVTSPFPRKHALSNSPTPNIIGIYVFSAADVDLRLDDKLFPLRKKGDTTVYTSWQLAEAATRQVATSITTFVAILYQTGTTFDDQIEQTLYKNNIAYEFDFEMRKLERSADPTKAIPIVWPVTPAPIPFPVPPLPPDEKFDKAGQYLYSTRDKDNVFGRGDGQSGPDTDNPIDFGKEPT